jgi:hypothetical protein
VDTISFIRDQLRQARAFLDGTLAGIDDATVHAQPPGVLNPIGATYAHVTTGEDSFVNGLLRGAAPLFDTTWAKRTGMSAPPPEGPGWQAWARSVRIDMPRLRAYGAAVADETEAWLETLTEGDLDSPIDLSSLGFAERTLGWALANGIIGHLQSHWGEMCALQGLRGDKGFPV